MTIDESAVVDAASVVRKDVSKNAVGPEESRLNHENENREELAAIDSL